MAGFHGCSNHKFLERQSCRSILRIDRGERKHMLAHLQSKTNSSLKSQIEVFKDENLINMRDQKIENNYPCG